MKFFILICVISVTVSSMSSVPGPPPCPQNEIYHSCGPNCQSECDTLNEPCLINHIRCPDGCYCIENYARVSPGGKCVPITQCSAKKPGGYGKGIY